MFANVGKKKSAFNIKESALLFFVVWKINTLWVDEINILTSGYKTCLITYKQSYNHTKENEFIYLQNYQITCLINMVYYNQWGKLMSRSTVQNIEFTVVHSSVIINCKVIFHQLGHFAKLKPNTVLLILKTLNEKMWMCLKFLNSSINFKSI